MGGNKNRAGTQADALALDFINRFRPGGEFKRGAIVTVEDFLHWLVRASLVPVDELERLKKAVKSEELEKLAAEARALGLWFRDFVVGHMGKPLTSDALNDLAGLNQVLEGDAQYRQVAASSSSEDGLVSTSNRRWESSKSLLLPIAETMSEFVCEADFTYVRMCEGKGCQVLFHDRTRARGRRWCSMAICGNRAKQATRRNMLHRTD